MKCISAKSCIQEKSPWAKQCVPGGKYFLTRNATTILAFAIGHKWKVCVCTKMPLIMRELICHLVISQEIR